jgi:hypothetical protein
MKHAVWASLIGALLIALSSVTQALTATSDQAVEQDSVEQQQARTARGGRGPHGNAIVGTWLSQIASGSRFIATFHEGGTVHITGQFDINATNNVVLSPRQGVWKHLGGRQFGVTALAVRYNPLATNTTPPVPAGSFISYAKIDYLLTISEDGDQLTGMNRAWTLDANWNVLSVTTNNNVPAYVRIKVAEFE